MCAVASRQVHGQQPVPVPPEAAKSRSTPYKDPALATALSVLIPGGGQLYAGRLGKGLAVLGGTAAAIGIAVDANQSSRCDGGGHSCNVHGVQTVAIVGAVAVWGYGWLTAGSDARRRNAQMLNGTSIAPFLDEHNGRMVAGFSLKTR